MMCDGSSSKIAVVRSRDRATSPLQISWPLKPKLSFAPVSSDKAMLTMVVQPYGWPTDASANAAASARSAADAIERPAVALLHGCPDHVPVERVGAGPIAHRDDHVVQPGSHGSRISARATGTRKPRDLADHSASAGGCV